VISSEHHDLSFLRRVVSSAFDRGQRLLDGFEQLEHTGEWRPGVVDVRAQPSSSRPSVAGWSSRRRRTMGLWVADATMALS